MTSRGIRQLFGAEHQNSLPKFWTTYVLRGSGAITHVGQFSTRYQYSYTIFHLLTILIDNLLHDDNIRKSFVTYGNIRQLPIILRQRPYLWDDLGNNQGD